MKAESAPVSCLLFFCCCAKRPWRKQGKGERAYLLGPAYRCTLCDIYNQGADDEQMPGLSSCPLCYSVPNPRLA